jgi:hypothetical protein
MALSSFHPTVRRWFESRLGNPTLPQVAAVGRWSRFRAMDDEAPTDVASPEQIEFALDEAVALVRKIRNRDESPLTVAAADPLNLRGILTPDERVSSHTQSWASVL